ncbi:hypothetical protein TrVFT333_010523 [Trichoderma virens FT-333]|nr:hypothetical protein TrVFT333_010523 [Trichoderma virens FT-333]
MLMHNEQVKTEDIYCCPVPGLLDDSIPTTEGMSGGERLPRALETLEAQFQEAAENIMKVRNKIKGKLNKTISWANDPEKRSREFAVKHLFPRILYTFSDVIVFIFREMRTVESDVFQLLFRWAATSIDKSLNQPSKPHVIIVLNDAKSTGDQNQWDPIHATKKLLDDHPKLNSNIESTPGGITTTKGLLDYYYSSFTVLKVPDKILLAKVNTQMQTLYQLIEDKCNASHQAKRQTRMLLNTEKLPIYINAALDHFRECFDQPFNFVTEARRHLSPPQDFRGHCQKRASESDEKVADCDPAFFERLTDPIASSVMLAAMRDNTQGTYSSLFESSYKSILWNAITEFQEEWLRCSFEDCGSKCVNVRTLHKKGHQSCDGAIIGQGEYQSKLDQGYFGHWIASIQRKIENEEKRDRDEEESSYILKMHGRNMAMLCSELQSDLALKNYLTCACCIGRTPEHMLPCGHIICTACVQFFGTRIEPGSYRFTSCPLHPDKNSWASPAQVKYKPEEAGVRVLCLDGGGVRGIVELVILQEIEKALGGHIPIQNFFDLIVGTSAGGIIALCLGVKHLRINDCLSRFKTLCEKSFIKRGAIKHAPIKNIARLLKTLYIMSGNSIYKSKPFSKALWEVFGENALLYHPPQTGSSVATRVAVTTTLAREDKAAILSNYNVERKSAKSLDDELKIWEAARATSAAPPYFKPFTQQKTGRTYIDGAIHHHCPVFIADQERRLLWEDIKDLPPISLFPSAVVLLNRKSLHQKYITQTISIAKNPRKSD